MNAWSWFWVAWLGTFCVVEGAALFNRRADDTLSETSWRWFHVFDPRRQTRYVVARMVLLAFLLWLAGHLTFGWWTPTRPWP